MNKLLFARRIDCLLREKLLFLGNLSLNMLKITWQSFIHEKNLYAQSLSLRDTRNLGGTIDFVN